MRTAQVKLKDQPVVELYADETFGPVRGIIQQQEDNLMTYWLGSDYVMFPRDQLEYITEYSED